MGSSVLHMLLLPPPRLRALLGDTLYTARTGGGGVVAALAAADAAVAPAAKRTGMKILINTVSMPYMRARASSLSHSSRRELNPLPAPPVGRRRWGT